jgi:hypothetical protein
MMGPAGDSPLVFFLRGVEKISLEQLELHRAAA